MTDPAVETVARALAEHQWQWRGEDPDTLYLGCTGCDWRSEDVSNDDASFDAAEDSHRAHVGAVVVAALRAAAGTADVDDLAQAARRAYWGERGTDSWEPHARCERIVRAVLDRLAVTGAEATSNGSGVSFGPTEPTPDVASGSVSVAADDDAVERASVGAADVDELAEVAWGAADGYVSGTPWATAGHIRQEKYRRAVGAVLDRLATTGGGNGTEVPEPAWMRERCECYPAGEQFGPEPGNAAMCPQHGMEAHAWRAGVTDARRALAAAAPVPVAAGDDAVERAPAGWMVLRAHPRDIGHLIDDWDGLDVHATRQDAEDALADANEAVHTHCGRAAGRTTYGLYEVRAALRAGGGDRG